MNKIWLTGIGIVLLSGCSLWATPPVDEDNTLKEVDITEEDLSAQENEGRLYNEDYGFTIDVGVDDVVNLTEVAIVPFAGVTATYIYCYDTVEDEYASSDCPGTAVEAFRINIYTSEQYADIADGPGAGTIITETAEYVYELSHPNGLLPDDVPASEDFYQGIIDSFLFTTRT